MQMISGFGLNDKPGIEDDENESSRIILLFLLSIL